MTTIRLIGAPVDCGSPIAGCLNGPTALRDAGLIDALSALGHQVIDAGDLTSQVATNVSHPNQAITRLAECVGWVNSLQQATTRFASEPGVPIFLGGDHLMAAGTIPPLCESAAADGRPLFVLWLDAHADFHTLASTETGNLHGTPAAYVCGQTGFEQVFPTLPLPLEPARFCQLGVRATDLTEIVRLERFSTRLISMSELEQRGARESLQPFLDTIVAANGRLHLSFDVDCLDPSVAPGVGTAVEHGVSLSQAREVMSLVRDCQCLSSVDIAELNPTLDPSGRSAIVVVQLMSVLFGQVDGGIRDQNQGGPDEPLN